MNASRLSCEGRRTMKRARLLGVLLGLSALSLSNNALAGQVFNVHVRDLAARAAFFSVDSSGVETDVFLFVARERVQIPPSLKSSGPFAFVEIVKFDTTQCFSLLMDAFGLVNLAEQDFQIDRQLTSATLNPITIPVTDFVSGTSFDLNVAMSWTGQGDSIRSKDNSQLRIPGFSAYFRFDGVFRSATVSGSISDGITDFASLPLAFADLASVKTGEIDLSH
jgi:hypothetical protein